MKLTKYESARLIGARALQLAMGAPLLLEFSEADFERLHYSPIEIAKLELEKNILPISIKRSMPQKTE
ncbi:DNA-directed RNA polymerase subunit K [Candidatus Woesearchaeota archaeon]|nr:DNA-directed RNA polymerase subunit K [Candidatus Woesearchaeota archaeon]